MVNKVNIAQMASTKRGKPRPLRVIFEEENSIYKLFKIIYTLKESGEKYKMIRNSEGIKYV